MQNNKKCSWTCNCSHLKIVYILFLMYDLNNFFTACKHKHIYLHIAFTFVLTQDHKSMNWISIKKVWHYLNHNMIKLVLNLVKHHVSFYSCCWTVLIYTFLTTVKICLHLWLLIGPLYLSSDHFLSLFSWIIFLDLKGLPIMTTVSLKNYHHYILNETIIIIIQIFHNDGTWKTKLMSGAGDSSPPWA